MSQFKDVHGSVRKAKKVLVLEDDVFLETLLARVFAQMEEPVEYTWATDIEQAKAELEFQDFDLILADLILPHGENGLDFWEHCQTRCPEIPFVVMSAVGADKFLGWVGRDRISPAFIQKPFYPGECRQVLEGIFDRAEHAAMKSENREAV